LTGVHHDENFIAGSLNFLLQSPDRSGRGITMSIAAINPVSPSPASFEAPKATPTQTSPASLPADTVSISPAAQKAASAGDVDHDGDSH